MNKIAKKHLPKLELARYSTLSDSEFISAIYIIFLDRNPDVEGRLYYSSRLAKGAAREMVAYDISQSAECANKPPKFSNLKTIRNKGYILNAFRNIKNSNTNESKVRPLDKSIKILDDEKLPNNQLYIQSRIIAKNVNIQCNDFLYNKTVTNKKNITTTENRNIWFDLTTCFEWQGGIVGIIRAELEIAAGLYKKNKNIRYCVQIANGFAEIDTQSILKILESNNITDSYLSFFGRNSVEHDIRPKSETITLIIPNSRDMFSPFKCQDIFLSVGWIDSEKEKVLNSLKQSGTNIFLIYLIYDTILLQPSTSFFYSKESSTKFKTYLKWVSHNCDIVLCGGNNTKNDVQKLQSQFDWPTPKSFAVKFGADIINVNLTSNEENEILEKIGITGDFIITVGTIEPRKNHITIYRAYLLALEQMGEKTPQLIFCGRPDGRVMDLINQIARSKSLKGKLIILSPTDIELSVLYKRCLFTLLPSIYEGWSLALPESLSQGKFCIAADVPPLKEIANSIIEYVAPFDTREWANKMMYYSTDREALAQGELRVRELWRDTDWSTCSANIFDIILKETDNMKPRTVESPIWFDLTTSFLHVPGVISGIIRVELSYAKFLHKIHSNVHYFAYANGKIFEIDKDKLSWLFESEDVAASFKFFYEFWSSHEAAGTGSRIPFNASNDPTTERSREIDSFGDNAIIFLVNIDWELKWTTRSVDLAKKSKNALVAQFIHDATPMVVPHLHQERTCEQFEPFFNYCSNNILYLQYGGKTAQKDGINIQNSRQWTMPDSDFIKLASDFKSITANTDVDRQCLNDLGIRSRFLITVGTIEPRKNHEVLYKSYLKLITENVKDLPQLIFVGKPGWLSGDLLASLTTDERIANVIKIVTPDDFQLDVLYRNCMFALLPSYYEGYSLTLNECLSYGKFCIASDTPSLREVGRELADYVNPNDTHAWATQMEYYINNPSVLLSKTKKVRDNWKTITWIDSASELLHSAQRAQKRIFKIHA